MAVDPEGDGDRGVAEAFLDDPGVDAAFKGEGRPCVAETVEGQPGEPVTADSTEERGADRVGPQPRAVGLVEDEVRRSMPWLVTASDAAPTGPPGSRREMEVLVLVARGRRNREIADALGISAKLG